MKIRHSISLYRPGSPAVLEPYRVELTAPPTWAEVIESIIDYFPPDESIQLLYFLDETGARREMFVHDLGKAMGAKENDLATAIWRRQWPPGHPNRVRKIYGIAVVFDAPIWRNGDH